MKYCIGLLLITSVLTAQKLPKLKSLPYDSASVPRERWVDFTHLDLKVSFQAAFGVVEGEVKHDFTVLRQTLDSLELDGPEIRIKSITQNGVPLKYASRKEKITVFFDKPLLRGSNNSISIRYEASPRKGIYFVGWNDATNRCRKQIWTQGQGIDNRHWIPMFDNMNDKITTDIRVRMDKNYKVLSNGELRSSNENGSDKIWHYAMTKPHAPYLIMLGIGDYEIETRKSKSGVPIHLWYYPDQKEKVEPTYRYSVEMFDFFEEEIGVPYPWPAYSQIPVQEFMYGAMENTTATIFGDFFYVDSRSYLDKKYVGVNAHELAHQWFGDMVTAIAPTHHWLQESFATHYNMMYEARALGKEYGDLARRNAQNSALNASVRDGFPVASSNGGSPRWYPKGAMVLNMLKYVVGRDCFNDAIKYYLERNAYGNVDSHDLLRAFHERCGESLDWFWEQWLYRAGEPAYSVTAESDAIKTVFNVRQLQMVEPFIGLFKMPIEFEVWFTDGTVARTRQWIEQADSKVEIVHPVGKKVAFTLFDPDNQIVKTVTFTKPTEQLKLQAVNAPNMLDRLDALTALSEKNWDEKRKTLQNIARKATTVKERQTALEMLSGDRDKSSRTLIAEALSDKHFALRQTAISVLDTLTKNELKAAKVLLNDSSYVTVNEALKKLIASDPSNTQSYLDATQNTMGDNSRNVRFTWLRAAIKSGKIAYEKELVDLCSVSFDFNTRKAAFAMVKELNIANSDLVRHAFEAANSTMFKLNGNGMVTLRWMYNEKPDLKPEIDRLLNSLGDSDRERNLVEKIRERK
ncbi:MAG: M1 family metallopeptidase [Bacteroidia bacterium]